MAQSCPVPARIATAPASSRRRRARYALSVSFAVRGTIVLLLAAGCSGAAATVDAGASADAGDQRLFVPAGIPNTNQDGQDVGLALIAFTLVPGTDGPSFYAA